jgi:hypothetical protein
MKNIGHLLLFPVTRPTSPTNSSLIHLSPNPSNPPPIPHTSSPNLRPYPIHIEDSVSERLAEDITGNAQTKRLS